MASLSTTIARTLAERQLPLDGWSYLNSSQISLEATALAGMASDSQSAAATAPGIQALLRLQRQDGGWPAFVGDRESSWTTALALCALNQTNDFTDSREKAFRWLLAEQGREGHWLWRWKFKTSDRNVRFDPDKYGWPWSHGAGSWVIPTAFSIVAIKQTTVCNRSAEAESRIRLGIEMLLDRACVNGGWNSGNSVVYGVPMRPHVEATGDRATGAAERTTREGHRNQPDLVGPTARLRSSQPPVSPGRS